MARPLSFTNVCLPVSYVKQVQDGRWARTEVPNMVEGNPSEIEPDVYNKLRSPWNVNNRP